jgi:hypothetical protein
MQPGFPLALSIPHRRFKMEKHIIDYKNLLNLIDSETEVAFKYQQIKAQERYLLEYLIFPKTEDETYHKLTNAAQFIHECMPVIKERKSANVMFQTFLAIETLKVILSNFSTYLDDIPEVANFKTAFIKKPNYLETQQDKSIV